MDLLLATGNSGKVVEIHDICNALDWNGPCPFVITSLKDVGFSGGMPEETGTTYEENSQIKAREIAMQTGLVTVADDSGLEVLALGGRPGLYSSRYGTSDNDRIERLLQELGDEVPSPARFVCVATIASPQGACRSFSGEVAGQIVGQRAGSSGFGFDPVFYMPEEGCTMAELSLGRKNSISHRAVAFAKLFHFLLDDSAFEFHR